MESIDGKIAAILSRTSVVINRGLLNGVEENDSFLIYTQLGPFYDPDTNVNLGTTTKVWGRVTVKIVEDRFCVAETGYIYKNPLDLSVLFGARSVFGGTTEQIQLPVKEEQIKSGLAKIEVGFLAKLVKQEKAITEKKVEVLAPKPIESTKLLEEEESVLELTENNDVGSDEVRDEEN